MRKRKYVPNAAIARLWQSRAAKQRFEADKAQLAECLTDHEVSSLMLVALLSLDHFLKGNATKVEWNSLTFICNITEAIDELGFGSQCQTEIGQASIALKCCGMRHIKLGKFGFTGPELEAVREVLSIHRQQLEQITRATYNQAVDLMDAKFARKEATKVVS